MSKLKIKNANGVWESVAPSQKEFDTVKSQLADTANKTSVGVSIIDFPRLDGEIDDLPRFQRAIDFLSTQNVGSQSGGRLVIPNNGTSYLAQFSAGSTINNPTRVKIIADNIEIVGVGNPLIEMKGLDINYLLSIDDYASSGRDIFTVFSFCGVKNSKISGIRFKGEYTGNQGFRFQSPRSIAVGFKGCSDCLAEDLYGEDILGNLFNSVNSMGNYDAPFANCYNIQVNDCHAVHCLENGFNYMGGNFNSKVSGLSATRCANGLESASDGLIVDGGIFRGNRSSGIGLSGNNQILNGVIACESITYDSDNVPLNNTGFGIIITGGEGVQINGGKINDNANNGICIYPGVKNVKGNGVEIHRNAIYGTYKHAIYIAGSTSKMIEDVSFSNSNIICSGSIIISQVNFGKNICFINNTATLESGNSSVVFENTCNGSRAVGNKFNKPVTMNDPTGEEYSNGLYRYIDRTSIPTTGTWILGDIINNRQRSQGGIAEWNCIQSGTFGTLNGGATTGSISAGSNSLIVNNATGLYVGCYINITGVTGVKKVIAVNGTSIVLDNNADANVTNATVSYRAPVIIPSRQNGIATNITSAPQAIGFTAVVGGNIYQAKGTSSSSDWVQVS